MINEIETAWCPCQEDRFADTNIEEHDLPYVVDYLEEVKPATYYKQKREQNRDPASLSRTSVGPKTPRTRRGTKIIDKNFPEADLVCPCCERGFAEEVERTVRPLEPESFTSNADQTEDMDVSDAAMESVIEDNPDAVTEYKNGDEAAVNFLVGQILQETGGRVDPAEARDAIREYFENRVVEVVLPYENYYTTSERIEVIDNIPDTDQARELFQYPPRVEVTFEWDKDENTLDPQSVEIGDEKYNL